MSLNDPIADMLTRIRNANAKHARFVEMPSSFMKVGIAEAMKREGFIDDFQVVESEPSSQLKVFLRYGEHREQVIRNIERISHCGKRVFSSISDIRPVLKGQGIAILSTNKGIISDREARKLNVGGEVLCRIW